MTDTYVGTLLGASLTLPATDDAAGYGALTFIQGACTLWECPPLSRSWGTGSEELVCQETSFEYKTTAKWEQMPVKFSAAAADAALAIYTTLEADSNAAGAFELILPSGGGTFYFTAQVAKFALFDGGNKEAIQTRSGMLLLKTDPVYVAYVAP